jgi:hypothetical protein
MDADNSCYKSIQITKECIQEYESTLQLEVNLLSDKFNIKKYESIEGFISPKFWKSSIFFCHGKSTSAIDNFNAVVNLLRTKYQ